MPQDYKEIDFSGALPNSENSDLYKFRIPNKFYPEYVFNEVDKYFIFHGRGSICRRGNNEFNL